MRNHAFGYYNRDGGLITMWEWTTLFSDAAYKRVALDEVITPDGRWFRVSTVWLGLDHGMGMSELPMIFESMVFGPDTSAEEYMTRYATLAQAEAGHAGICHVLATGRLPNAGEVTP